MLVLQKYSVDIREMFVNVFETRRGLLAKSVTVWDMGGRGFETQVGT